MEQSALGKTVGIGVITTIIFAITGLVRLIRYILTIPSRKERKKLLVESMRVSSDGKKMCIHCKKFTDDEVNNKDGIFCIECGWQRGTVKNSS